MFTQGGDQFDSNLTERAGEQDLSHIHHPTALPPTSAKAPNYSIMALRPLANIPSERFHS